MTGWDALIDRVMTTDYVKPAIPFFILAIAMEYAWSRRQKLPTVRLNDGISSLSAGVFSLLAAMFTAAITFGAYAWVYEHWRIWDVGLQSTEIKAVLALAFFVVFDHQYYWFHRAAHEVNLGWAMHIAHHQSEDYNLTTALRQSATQSLFSSWFYMPLAVLGCSPAWIVGLFSLNTVFQFWLHTERIGKLPRWIEAVLNTPSHHRVHHGTNPQYLDRNHAGNLIIWDRLYGTFEPEIESVRYGITSPLRSWNPIWVQLHYFVFLAQRSVAAKSAREVVKIWLGPPSQFEGEFEAKLRGEASAKFDPPLSPADKISAGFTFVLGLGISLVAIGSPPDFEWRFVTAGAGAVLLLLAGVLLQPRRGAKTH